jgi:hypothetical protein
LTWISGSWKLYMYAKFTLSRQLSAIILFIHMKYKPLVITRSK